MTQKNDFGTTEIAPGICISRFAFGTAALGGLFTPVSSKAAVETIQHAMESGVTYFDSALYYGGGKALEALGIALGEEPSRDLVISFKVGRVLATKNNGAYTAGKKLHNISGYAGSEKIEYVFDYSAAGVERAFNQSMFFLNEGRRKARLRNLAPQDLNIVIYAHDPEVGVHGVRGQTEVMETLLTSGFPKLKTMQDGGLIKAYGIGTNEIKPCLDALKDPHIKLMLLAGRGTLLCNGATNSPSEIKKDGVQMPELLHALKEHRNKPMLGIASIGNGGLGYGGNIYNYAPAKPNIIEFRDAVFKIAARHNTATAALLVHYPLDHFGEQIAYVMPGPRSIEEFNYTAQTFDAIIPDSLWSDLERHGKINQQIGLGGELKRSTNSRN